jgi:hypothetical protein
LYEKTDVELEGSVRADVEKWMANFKKAPPLKKFAEETEAKRKMVRSLTEPKKLLPSNYKRTIKNKYCVKRSDEILQNQDDKQN